MRVLLICSLLVGLSVCSPSLFYRPDSNFIYPGHPNHPNTKNHNKKTGKNWNKYPSGSPLAFRQSGTTGGQLGDSEIQVSANGQPIDHPESFNFQMPSSSQASASIVSSNSQSQQNFVQQTDSSVSTQSVDSVAHQTPSVSGPLASQPELETIVPVKPIQQTFNNIPSNIAIPQPLETIHASSNIPSHATFVSQQGSNLQSQSSNVAASSVSTQQIQPPVLTASQISKFDILPTILDLMRLIKALPTVPQQPVISQPNLETIVPVPPKQPASSLELITPQKPSIPAVPLETIHDIKPQIQQQFQPQQPIQQVVQPVVPQVPTVQGKQLLLS